MGDPKVEQHILAIELENSNLASLYVALSHLHSTLDVNEVLRVIVEILLNFMGAETFAVMVFDREGRLHAIAAHGVSRGEVPLLTHDDRMVGNALASGTSQITSLVTAHREEPLAESPFICIPLHAAGEIIGVLPVWSFLQQKTELTDIDHEIMLLMSKSAGTALEAARLAMTAPPNSGGKGYYEAFAALIE